MDRNKPSSSNRGQKKMSGHSGNEFFALGVKGSRGDDAKSKLVPLKNTSSTADRKREATSTLTNPTKKPKLVVRLPFGETSCSLTHELWEQMAVDCEPVQLVEQLFSVISQHDNESVLRLLCGSIRCLTELHARAKLDIVLNLVLLYVAKIRPSLFSNDCVTSALVYILRRDTNIKSRQSTCSHILAANLLCKGYSDIQQWPETFLRIYIDDAINDRIWSDSELCAPFINNICSAFQTCAPSQSLLQLESLSAGGILSGSGQQHRDVVMTVDDDSGDNSTHGVDPSIAPHLNLSESGSVSDTFCGSQNHYVDSENIVEKYTIDAIKEQLNKRQQQDCYTRNFLKFLCTTSGLADVRYLCIARLELWIHNGKLVKFAQQLLSYICFNLRSKNYKDHEVLAVLVKIRLKTKPLINFYMTCLKEMIIQQPDILCIVLKLVVQNELSNTRNPNNMGMLATMFQSSPEQSAKHLAEIYKEFLLQREDCLRTLRVFLRELVRILRYDIGIVKFCNVFLSDRPDLTKQIENSEFRERIFHSMVDIMCLCMLLTVSPQVREASMFLRTSREIKSNPVLLKLYSQMSQIQLDVISWMHETVPSLFQLQSAEFNQALHKILLLDSPEQYSRCDQWPSEPERGTLLRIVSETPVREDTVLRLILIGITKEIPFSIPETIDIIMLLLKRASNMRIIDCPAIQANKIDIIDFLFNMVEYHHPENIKLPADYEPPKLAITVLYWKVWLIMLMISAHNPSTFGAFCWNQYPTMKMLIEMCITNQFSDHVMAKDELQIISIERDHILQFEGHLAAQTSQAIITEDNAILISQLMLMDPFGTPRRVPTIVLDQLKYINKTLKLGHLLCRSRKPDLLLDIIQRQGTTQSMPWLSDLVQNSEGDFNHLPVQCLCEFLLFNANIINEENSRDAELVNYLRNLIVEPDANKQIVCEVLDYIFRRLSSTVKQSRAAAMGGIKIIFKCSDLDDNDWLLRSIPQIPHFTDACRFIMPQLRSACQVENSPELIMAYIQFIAAHTLNEPVTEMLDNVIDMAQLIVERSTMFQHIIPVSENSNNVPQSNDGSHGSRFQTLKCLFVMFNNYIIKLREHHEPYEWTEYPDLLMVQFDDGVQLPLHLNIIHAFIILLTHSSNTMPESIPILDYWFPPGRSAPNAYLPNLSHEPVQLLPDWLKLKMIRSSVDRLIDAALHELTPDQIVLFVQNFGTPVNSMSKLLALLDRAVIEQFDDVKNAILNKAYLAQLIEIQQARGAKNGHFTVQAMGLHSHSQTIPDLPKLDSQTLEVIKLTQFSTEIPPNNFSIKSKETEEVINIILKCPKETYLSKYRFRRFVHQLLKHFREPSVSQKDFQLQACNKAFSHFMRFFDRPKTTHMQQNMSQKNHICTFFRSLLKCISIKLDDYNLMLQLIGKLANFSNSTHNVALGAHYQLSLLGLLQNKRLEDEVRIILPKEVLDKETLQLMITSSSFSKLKCDESWSHKIPGNNFEIFYNSDQLCCDGLLVDWLSEVDPELIMLNKTFQINILFSKACSYFSFYLLSLICHQTNWETLIATLNYLLQQSPIDFDCSTVLNFIEALINNPKLWQGCDKSVSRANELKITFALNDNELDTFTQFILKEGESEIDSDPGNYDYKLCSRINLLFRVTNRKSSDIVKFIEYVFKNSSSYNLRLKVLQQMYLMYPAIKFIKSSLPSENAAKLQTLKGCETDKVSSYLITCLGNLFLKKDFEALSSDTELLMRKLAASHPALFLRQLGVLSSLIQGRAQINVRAFRDEYHFHRFIQILRTLELLQPMLFDDTYKFEFQTALECYFTFFKHHSYIKEAYHVLVKFVEILQTYINLNPSSALLYIEQHVSILMELAIKFHSVASLHHLVQGIALLQNNTMASNELNEDERKQEFDFEDQIESKTISTMTVPTDPESSEVGIIPQIDISTRGAVSFAISGSYNKSITVSSHFMNLIKLVKHSNAEDAILSPLQEIESLTSKRFSFLSELFDRLLELIFSPSAQIRSNAFILLIRHLKHNPGRSDINFCALNAYIQCLRDDNSSVATTAVDNLSEMTIILQEHAVEILAVAFSLGIRSRLNTSTQIKRVLQTLMLQHGY